MNDVIVLGLDGVDFHQLMDYRDSLPNLSDLFEDSIWGKLRSTIPPATSAAWTTALSGMSPGRTGITDFGVTDNPEKDGRGVVDSTDVRTPRIWDVVEAHNGRSAVIGAPVTYPATKIDGLMISGFMSQSTEYGHVHPPELASELPDDYRFFIPYSDYNSSDKILDDIYASTDAKFNLLEQVLCGELPGTDNHLDLICFVLSESDWIQHYFFHQPEDRNAEAGREVVRKYLIHVDERVGELLSMVDEQRTVGLLSDHGFGKCSTHHIHLNEWLSRKDYLVVKDNDEYSSRIRRALGQRIREVARIPGFRHLKNWIPKSAKRVAIELSTLEDRNINWGRTKAIFRKKFSNTGYVELNCGAIDTADTDAVAEELIESINDLTDPETGDDIIEEIHRREDYYKGPHVESIPEIVFIFEEPYTGNEQVGGDIVKELPLGGRPDPAHRMDGFFCIADADIEKGHRINADIHQFAPSLYSAMDLPNPDPIDGEPIMISGKSTGPQRFESISYDPEFAVASPESEDVEQRLTDLGYL